MDARGVPKEDAKDAALTRPIKFIPELTIVGGGKTMVPWKQCLWFPREHEMPPVTGLLICGTGQALRNWDFSALRKPWRLRWQSLLWLGAFKTSSLRADPVGQSAACYFCLRVYSAGCRYKLVLASFGWPRPERIFSLVTKPNSQDRTRWEENLFQFFLNRGPASKSPETGAGLAQTTGLQDLPTFYPRIFLLMIKDRQKGERTNRKWVLITDLYQSLYPSN